MKGVAVRLESFDQHAGAHLTLTILAIDWIERFRLEAEFHRMPRFAGVPISGMPDTAAALEISSLAKSAAEDEQGFSAA